MARTARSRSQELTKKTHRVYQEVVEHEDQETVLSALQRVEEVLAKAGPADELRQVLDVETAHLRDVIDSKQKLQETVGTLIAGYDSLTNALGGEIDSMKEMTLWENVVGVFSSRAARDMRERRVQGADIDTQLQDLVSQTQAIAQPGVRHGPRHAGVPAAGAEGQHPGLRVGGQGARRSQSADRREARPDGRAHGNGPGRCGPGASGPHQSGQRDHRATQHGAQQRPDL
jgi:hypothetical protein